MPKIGQTPVKVPLIVTYKMWGRVAGEPPYRAEVKGRILRFSVLEEAREAAKREGFSGIRVKGE